MIDVGGIRVNASIHAAERALERVPVLRRANRDNASYWVERTVMRAVRDGRKARSCPRWCVREWEETPRRRRAKTTSEGTARFVWNEDETVAFLIRRQRCRVRGEPLWLVITVIVPTEAPDYTKV